MSNLKQIGLAFSMYAEDYDGRYPKASQWIEATSLYTKNDYLYRCPSVDYTYPITRYGYAFNSLLARHLLKQVSHPEMTPLVYDSNNLARNASAPGLTDLAFPPRHYSGKAVIGYADGHVKAVQFGRDLDR